MPAVQAQRRELNIKAVKLRKAGLLPIALTKRDHTTVNLSAPVDEVLNAVKHADGHGRFEVSVDGDRPMKVILKCQEVDWLHHRPLSATLQEVTDSDVLKMDVPVVAVGTPEPVAANTGTLVQPTDHLKLRGRMSDLPETIEVDVSHLQINESVHASDVTLAPGIELFSPLESTLFTIQSVVSLAQEEPLEPQLTTEEEAAEAEAQATASEDGGQPSVD
jgi:large subunit ribosomal protein L25